MTSITNLKKECDVLGKKLGINSDFLVYYVLSKLSKGEHTYLNLKVVKKAQVRFELRKVVKDMVQDLYNRKGTQNPEGRTSLDWWEHHFYFQLREGFPAKDDRVSFLRGVLDELQIPHL